MLFYLTGSSRSGKTTIAMDPSITTDLQVHDTDEIGVPSTADLVWRQRSLETWVHRVLDLQARGYDTLLTGQSPLGEILSAPSSCFLDGIAVALVDVDDRHRWTRIGRRDPGR